MQLPNYEPKKVMTRRAAARPAAMTSVYAVPELDRVNAQAAARTLAEVLWKGKWTLAAAAICGLLAGGALVTLTTPVYRARVSLLLEGFNDQATREVTPVSPLPASPIDYLQNEVKVLESDNLARRVAARLGVQTSDQAALDKLKKKITVSTGMQSEVMEVFFDAPDADRAAKGANAVALELMNLNREARTQLVEDTTEWLNNQAAELKGKLEASNRQLQEFTSRNGLLVVDKGESPVEDRARQLQDALTKAEADRATKEAKYDAAVASQGYVPSDALDSGPLRQYQTDLQTLKAKLAELHTIYQPDNYRITRVEAQIAEAEEAIKKERGAILERERNDYLAAASLEKMLAKSAQGQLDSLGKQTAKELQYNVLKNEVETNQKLYDAVLERAKDAGAASSLRVTNIRVIDSATPPRVPYSPNLLLDLAFGLGVGTLGGAALVLLRTGSGKVRQPGELAAASVPELGVVPSSPGELRIMRPDWLARNACRQTQESSLLWESFRSVLISILFRAPVNRTAEGGDGRVLVVTSLDMKEGKTTVATNLAIASAQHKHDVLLIDADLRRPRLHHQFDVTNNVGLVDLLRHVESAEDDNCWPESFIQPTQIPHLWVLPSGRAESGATDLLFGPGMGGVLQKLARRFDLIFIDTPPMAMYTEARLLGRMSDGVVMVVRANTRNSDDLRMAYQKLLDDHIPVLGTILNDWRANRRQARAYSRYYRHYQQQTAKADA